MRPEVAHTDLIEMLWTIPCPSDSETWRTLGMSAKAAGITYEEFDSYSQTGAGYNEAENRRRWKSWTVDGGITAATLISMAIKNGYQWDGRPISSPAVKNRHSYDTPTALSFEGIITSVEVDPDTGEYVELSNDEDYNAAADMRTYLETLFEPEEIVNIRTEYNPKTQADGTVKMEPGGWGHMWVVKDLTNRLSRYTDVTYAIGSYSSEGGGWVVANPFVANQANPSDKNISAYRHCVIESDDMPQDDQYRWLLASHLPISLIVDSAGKSLHALVRVDAKNLDDYHRKFDTIADFCEQNGFSIDRANRNPSRMTRLPGLKRGNRFQRIVHQKCGEASYEDWLSWVHREQNKQRFGSPESIDSWELEEDTNRFLIDGLLIPSSLLLWIAPSKAGKSLSVSQCALCVAAGIPFWGHKTVQSPVLYLNLEIDSVTMRNRIRTIGQRMGLRPEQIKDFHVWNLRSKIKINELDQFLEALEEEIIYQQAAITVLDPLYILESVSGTDSNDMTDVGALLTRLQGLMERTKTAIILVHHISSKIQNLGEYNPESLAMGSNALSMNYDSMVAMLPLDTDRIEEITGVEYSHKAFRVEYRSRLTETPAPDVIVADYPLFTKAPENHFLHNCPTVSSETYKRREKARAERLERDLISWDWEENVPTDLPFGGMPRPKPKPQIDEPTIAPNPQSRMMSFDDCCSAM